MANPTHHPAAFPDPEPDRPRPTRLSNVAVVSALVLAGVVTAAWVGLIVWGVAKLVGLA